MAERKEGELERRLSEGQIERRLEERLREAQVEREARQRELIQQVTCSFNICPSFNSFIILLCRHEERSRRRLRKEREG